ncbi:MAG TPA: histidine kinase [Bryobacteraceae bacterium]|nr:histidine kinase [Bryobacteraceae bacterium]
MFQLNQPLLINILGHAAGALIFAIFLCLLFSRRGWSGSHGRFLSGLAAALSLAWNLGSLLVLAWPGLSPHTVDLLAAFSFSVLSLLPAVLLQVSLDGRWPMLAFTGYGLSSAAIFLHWREIYTTGSDLHQMALLLTTFGFLALTAIAVMGAILDRESGRAAPSRIAASMCLALFAMSFLHFGHGHLHQAWSSELVVHHAGIPLALFVLLQDYRFVLLDAFVRFLANALLAAVLTWLVIAAAFRLVLVKSAGGPLAQAFLLISVCLCLVFFAWLRNCAQAWLTHAVFRHGGLDQVASAIKDAPAFSGEDEYLTWAAGRMASTARADRHAVVAENLVAAAAELHSAALAPAELAAPWNWAEVIVPVRLGQENSRLILLGRRNGGQRYLGEDLEALTKAASAVAERLDMLRRQEMSRLVAQAELRALQSQINPHFLFNAFNTLYGVIPREAFAARRLVLNLADIFRYFLQSEKTFVPLAEEMQIVRAYLEIEKVRLGPRLEVDIQVEEAALRTLIPVLSVQPLVENAVKHGIAQRADAGFVRIRAHLADGELRVSVVNSGAPPVALAAAEGSPGAGIGLQNVQRRLEICYGSPANLRFHPSAETTTVEFSIPMPVPAAHR